MRQIAPKASADDSLGGERLICRSVRPDVVSYSSAITACGKAGQRRRALALLGDMRVEGVPPNVRFFVVVFLRSGIFPCCLSETS